MASWSEEGGSSRARRRIVPELLNENESPEQPPPKRARPSTARVRARLALAAATHDDIGRVPKMCRVRIDESEIPPHLVILREAARRKFDLHRSLLACTEIPYPEGEVFMEWGRKWMIKKSTIENGGMGLFAQEDIYLNRGGNRDFKVSAVPLFPYVGPTYTLKEYDELLKWYPQMRRYSLQIVKGSYSNPEQLMVVGFARGPDNNLAAYINSNRGFERETGKAAVEWQHVDAANPHCYPFRDEKCQRFFDIIQNQTHIRHYVMTVARRNIAEGQELFINYNFMKEHD